jgi:signal transduction histidine kinase
VRLELAITQSGSESLQEEILRLVTEALSNALRHSGAVHVNVLVESDSSGWRLRVQDDGRGFDTSSESPGMGLGNLTERTTSLGGSSVITSSPGIGTMIEIKIPAS